MAPKKSKKNRKRKGVKWVDPTKDLLSKKKDSTPAEELHTEDFDGEAAVDVPEMMNSTDDPQAYRNERTRAYNLTEGEQLHTEDFDVEAAMNVPEMMNPTDDPQAYREEQTKAYNRAISRLHVRFDNFQINELIAIMDNILCSVVTHLHGYNMAQTIFTSVYMQKPEAILDRRLRTFCMGIINITDAMRTYIKYANGYEEEDYQPNDYGFQIHKKYPEAQIISMTLELELQYSLEGRLHRPRSCTAAQEAASVYGRIRFVRLLYQVLITMRVYLDPLSLRECGKRINDLFTTLRLVKSTVSVGCTPGGRVMGYDPLINQKMIELSVPQELTLFTIEETLDYFQGMLNRFKRIFEINGMRAVDPAIAFFIEFNNLNPCILTRAALPLFYRCTSNIIYLNYFSSMHDALKAAATRFTAPPSLTVEDILKENTEPNKRVKEFFLRCAGHFGTFFITFASNKGRQRRQFKELVVKFASLQEDAENLDSYLQEQCARYRRNHIGCFKTWITYYLLRLLDLYLTTGFELSLYEAYEYYYIFWNLQYLYEWLCKTLLIATTILIEQEITKSSLLGAFKKEKNILMGIYGKLLNTHAEDQIFYGALQHMANAYYKALVAFGADGKLDIPPLPISQKKRMYERIFEICNCIGDSYAVSYEEFIDITAKHKPKNSADIKSLYLEASQHFMNAKEMLEKSPYPVTEMAYIIKVAKTNCITLKLVVAGVKEEFNASPRFDFITHRYFPIIKFM